MANVQLFSIRKAECRKISEKRIYDDFFMVIIKIILKS